ncbi:MAG: sigma 54-interacting transcriptional regulator [Desulfotignum sp.]
MSKTQLHSSPVLTPQAPDKSADNVSLVFELLDKSDFGILAYDTTGHLIYINETAQQIFDVKADHVLGKPVLSFIYDTGLLQFIAQDPSDLNNSYEWKHRSILVRASKFCENDRVKGCLLVLHKKTTSDITSNDEFNWIKEEFASLLESSYDGIIVADGKSILQVNASFGRITGLAPGMLIGKNINELETEEHACLAAVQEVIRLTSYHKKTLTLQRRLNTGNEIFLTGNPVFDRHGQVIRVLINVRDVTELKSLEDQIKKVSSICENFNQLSEEKREFFQGIVAESPPMRKLVDLVLRISRVDSTILLVGESGVGKDVFARLIYRLSKRNQYPFISVNCGAIPENLLESEFFGYIKGAFTGADSKGKSGLFEQANKGILFLDEVGELPLHLQVKLLKVIQDRRCRRLGDNKDIDLDIRIIAATNKDLNEMVSDGLFRADLFYRLYVVPINIPALRERREDILPLSLMFLNQFNTKYNVSKTLDHELMSVLENYDWPGNVRELANVVERMVVTARTDVLMPDHLPDSIKNRNAGLSGPHLPDTMNLKEAQQAMEFEMIKRAVIQTGSTRKAGQLLGVNHSTVLRKAKRCGLDIQAAISQNKVHPSPGDPPH